VRAVVNSHVRAMIDLQLLTAARCGELLRLRPCDIDRSGKVWMAKLSEHKETFRGKERVLYFGPRAQAILREQMLGKRPDDPIWTFVYNSYWHHIRKACDRAEVPHWHPHQLRHNAATYVRKEFGVEMAAIISTRRPTTPRPWRPSAGSGRG